MSESKHTPTKLMFEQTGNCYAIFTEDRTRGDFAAVFGDDIGQAKSRAELIVRATNNHDQLVEALKGGKSLIERMARLLQCRPQDFAEYEIVTTAINQAAKI